MSTFTSEDTSASMAGRIRDLVNHHPKSRQQIAADLYISTDCLGNYITGRRCPDAAMVCKMALYFHVSTDYILGVSQEENLLLPSIAQENSLLNLFRSMTPVQRECFLCSAYGIANSVSITPAIKFNQ